MKILVDMNLSPRWTDVLREDGHTAAHWSELGSASAPDLEIMSYAREHSYVVLTHDLDFGSILAATNGAKTSVVQIRANNVIPDVVGLQVKAGITRLQTSWNAGLYLQFIQSARGCAFFPSFRTTRLDAARQSIA